MMEPELYLQSTYAQQCWALWSFWFQVQLFYWEERLGLTPLWQQESSHSLDWSVASAKCLVTDPDAEEALVKFCPAGQSSSDVSEQGLSFPPFLSGPQDRCHQDVWWEALSAQVQVTQEAVLLIDSRFGFFKKIMVCMCWRRQICVRLRRTYSTAWLLQWLLSYLSVVCQLAYIYISSTDVKVQLCFSQWYLKTIVLNSNSCEDVSS